MRLFIKSIKLRKSKRGEAVKLYIGEDYILESDFRYENFQKLVSKYQGRELLHPGRK